ncbi:MAG TPA: hypothetical protein DCZ95_17785 [Verrucomicrobia bacterium]|nr:MAG: hypothetical protein A2X46_07465 [Lentisphaerae bacterium GWF2_57_35]HBA85938.1 hypothetical protein [Verrucomicrobiota bacterium]
MQKNRIRVATIVMAAAAFAWRCCLGAAEVEQAAPLDSAALAEQWGIELVGVRLSAAGYMIDFRYKVLDPDKAAPLAKRENKPYLVDQASKAKLLVPTTPKIGALRQTATQLIPGCVYGAMFANPAQVVKAGSKVTVVVGDFKAADLVVQ